MSSTVAELRAMCEDTSLAGRIQDARQRFLEDGRPPAATAAIRADILHSWSRCQEHGVDPERDPDAEETTDFGHLLLHAAGPVLERLAGQLGGTDVCAVLADRRVRILSIATDSDRIDRGFQQAGVLVGSCHAEEIAGTNGLGTAVELRRPTVVFGPEHFRESVQDFTCIGVPIRHPTMNRVEGVLDLACVHSRTSPLLLPLLQDAVRDIEARLLETASPSARALLDAFIRHSRRSARPTLAVGADIVLASPTAAQLIAGADHAILRAWAAECTTTHRPLTARIRLAGGREIVARAEPVAEPDDAGFIITVQSAEPADTLPALRGAGEWARTVGAIDDLATRATSVLLHGEPGTGKLHLARRLHEHSGPGRGYHVLPVEEATCDPRGFLHRLTDVLERPGTVVLQHLETLPADMRAVLAARLARRPAGHRVVATLRASGPPEGLAGSLGALLDHLPAWVAVPSLRSRREDIPALVTACIADLTPSSPPPRCSDAALQVLTAYDWPRNLHQLRQVITTTVVGISSAEITPHDLPTYLLDGGRPLVGLERTERDTIVDVLRRTGWRRQAAAEELGISRSTLYRRMRSLHLAP